jgi:hypothetical protein
MTDTEKNHMKQKILKGKLKRLELDKMIADVQSGLKRLKESLRKRSRLKHLEET